MLFIRLNGDIDNLVGTVSVGCAVAVVAMERLYHFCSRPLSLHPQVGYLSFDNNVTESDRKHFSGRDG